MKPFKPMLAGKAVLEKLVYPVYATPKLDGIRAMITEDGVMSRNWELIPSKMVQREYGRKQFIGLDGELIYGSPVAPDVYRKTMSACSTADSDRLVTFYAFDRWNAPTLGYAERLKKSWDASIQFVEYKLCKNEDQLLAEEERRLEEGYEGLILRSPNGLYKYGRSTSREGGMLKFKRFVDSEAVVLEVLEEMENQNEKELNVFGRTKRSSHKENKVGKGRMGKLVVRDLKTDIVSKVGTGFDDKERAWFWKHRRDIEKRGKGLTRSLACIIKYKYFPIGVKDKPRHPVYLGIREGFDL